MSSQETDSTTDDQNQKVDYDPTKIDKEQLKGAPKALFRFLRDILSIKDEVDQAATVEIIKSNIVFRGANVWVLICSIIVACIGLNNDSTAVIIGAMLISPLMGPIRGMGLAIGTNDFKTLISSLLNFGVMVGISFVVAWLYFLVSPIKTATPELQSRVHPQALDVLIGFFGGLAGIIASATGDRSTVVPGVAIATALMPPMCTAAYGLAVGEPAFFFGALYLFLLNTVFICLSTVLTVRYLSFPLMKFVNPRTERKVKLYSFIVLLGIVVPSIWFFMKLVRENQFEESVKNFVKQEINYDDFFSNIELDEFEYETDTGIIYLKVISGYIEDLQIDLWQSKAQQYDKLKNTGIVLRNNKKPEKIELNGFISTEMYNDQKKTRQQLEASSKILRSTLFKYESSEINSEKLARLLKVNYEPLIDSIECGPMYLNNLHDSIDTASRYIIYWNPSLDDSILKNNKENLEQHIILNMESKNSKFLHINNYGEK